MSDHLPECPNNSLNPQPHGWPCICERLRACEQRVRGDERLAAVEWIADGFNKGWHVGYEVGTKATDAYGVMRDHWLDAAREAVKALDDGTTIPASDGIFEALAAIDALRVEEKECGGEGMKIYVKKPIPIEAIQFTRENWDHVKTFLGDSLVMVNFMYLEKAKLVISTLEGDMTAWEGDYIIRGVRGEIYSCKQDIFEETYEEVDNV